MAEQARASYENVVIAEYRLLNALVTNPMNFDDPRVTEYLFASFLLLYPFFQHIGMLCRQQPHPAGAY